MPQPTCFSSIRRVSRSLRRRRIHIRRGSKSLSPPRLAQMGCEAIICSVSEAFQSAAYQRQTRVSSNRMHVGTALAQRHRGCRRESWCRQSAGAPFDRKAPRSASLAHWRVCNFGRLSCSPRHPSQCFPIAKRKSDSSSGVIPPDAASSARSSKALSDAVILRMALTVASAFAILGCTLSARSSMSLASSKAAFSLSDECQPE